jgi:hypothetical protein
MLCGLDFLHTQNLAEKAPAGQGRVFWGVVVMEVTGTKVSKFWRGSASKKEDNSVFK